LEQYWKQPETRSATVKTYLEGYNNGHIAVANIESVPALNNLETLLSVDGLDAVFIGPHDLSVSLGLPEEYDHPEFEKAVTHIIKSCRSKGVSVGIHFSLAAERQVKWGQVGANMIIHSFDAALFVQRLASDMKLIRQGLGVRREADETDVAATVI